MKIVQILVIFVLVISVGGTATEIPVVVYANFHFNQSVDQYSLRCSSTPLNISIHNDQWNPIWNNATIIDLVNIAGHGPQYHAAGQTGNAFLGLECDSKWLYGFVAYMPPADETGHQGFHPSGLILEFDPNDADPSIPQTNDHLFVYAAGNNSRPTVHMTGIGVQNVYGGWDYNLQLYHDTSVIDFHDSVTRTPFFNLAQPLGKNPLYQFVVSRYNLLTGDTFGLYVELLDDFFVSKANNLQYAALLPGIASATAEYQLDLWPDITLLRPTSQTTTTSTMQSVPSSTSALTTSPRTEVTPSGGVLEGLTTKLVENSLLVGTSIATAGALSVLALYYARRKKRNS
jgi:hypothetical protein